MKVGRTTKASESSVQCLNLSQILTTEKGESRAGEYAKYILQVYILRKVHTFIIATVDER